METRSKYLKLSTRLEKSKKTGQFYQYSARKQNWLISRIKKLWEKLRIFEKQLKLAVAAGTLSLAMGLANPIFAQPSFVAAPGKNPLPPPEVYGMDAIIQDLDLDGDFDILVTQGDAEMVFYRNTGSASNPSFEMVPQDQNPFLFPEEEDIETWNVEAIVDIDGDGDLDMFTDDEEFKFFENTGTASEPVFEEATSPVGYFYSYDLADIDGDGDLDMVSVDFESVYNYSDMEWEYVPRVTVYPNTGTAQAANIDWNNPVDYELDNLPENLDYIDDFFPLDYEGDGDLDFLVKFDLYDELTEESSQIYHIIENTGTVSEPEYSVMDASEHPFDDLDLGWNEIYPVDIDDDGDLDAIVTYNYVGFTLYRNTGTALVMDNTISDFQGTVLPPSYIVPAFIDFDGDGDLDMYTFAYEDLSGVYYENTGTSQAPQFTEQEDYFPFLEGLNEGYYFPLFVDLDDDGDLDALVYAYDYYSYSGEAFYYYENTGTQQAPDYVLDEGAGFMPEIDDISTLPVFVDIDNDGDLDMFLTQWVYESDEDQSRILFYRNTGSPDEINFELQEGMDYPFDENLYLEEVYYNPLVFADLDRDGDYDLFFSDYYGNIFHFENTGTAESPFFVDASETSPLRNIQTGYYGGVTLVDLDGDGDLDLISTSLYSTIVSYYENTDLGGSPSGIRTTMDKGSLQVYPNPASDLFQIRLDNLQSGQGQLSVIDTDGRIVLSETFSKGPGTSGHEVDVSGIKPGLYLIKVTIGTQQETSRLIIR